MRGADVTGVAEWDELTPQAREVVRDEFERLLKRAAAAVPGGDVAGVRREAERCPQLIPHLVVSFRRKLGDD